MLAQAVHKLFWPAPNCSMWVASRVWVVNEGEYRMMNTLDLTVDQLFFEVARNPWTVANELDWFAKRYSFRDQIRLPGVAGERRGRDQLHSRYGRGEPLRTRAQVRLYEKAGLAGMLLTHDPGGARNLADLRTGV